MDIGDKLTFVGTIIPFSIINIFLITLKLKLKGQSLDPLMMATLGFLWGSLLIYCIDGIYVQWFSQNNNTSALIIRFIWYFSELIEKTAIMIDIARSELNLGLKENQTELEQSLFRRKVKVWFICNIVILYLMYFGFEGIQLILHQENTQNQQKPFFLLLEVIIMIYSDLGFVAWYISIIVRIFLRQRDSVYVLNREGSFDSQIASADLQNSIKKQKLAAMALLVLSITPVYIFRAVVIYISANNSDRWNLQIEITFGVLKCLMILGFCVAIFWRLKIAESYQDTKLNLLKKDSLVGIPLQNKLQIAIKSGLNEALCSQ